ncbi:MAG TPA: PHB depolymerase family esterase [Dehalococcoidia bacterium]
MKRRQSSKNLIFIAILVLVLMTLACARQPISSSLPDMDTYVTIHSGDYNGSLNVDGRKRSYILHIPPGYDNETKMPLVIVLHGGGGNAENIITTTDFSVKADATGFIVVYPNGTGRFNTDRLLTWNAGNCCGYASDNNVDDVAFIRALIDDLLNRLAVDPSRIYASGISNGGMMCYLLACQLSDKIAAIAPVSGAMEMDNCYPTQPVSVIIFHGTADEHVLYYGGKPLKQADNHPRIDKPVSYAVNFWVEANDCVPAPQKEVMGNIIEETYGDGKDDTEVVLYTIVDGKHAWPGGTPGWFGGDEPTKEISATDVIWNFFSSHPKP